MILKDFLATTGGSEQGCCIKQSTLQPKTQPLESHGFDSQLQY